jgi:hypothetical protein
MLAHVARSGKPELLTVLQACDEVRRFLAAIAREDLAVGSAMRAKLEGAVAALDVLASMTPAMPGGAS